MHQPRCHSVLLRALLAASSLAVLGACSTGWLRDGAKPAAATPSLPEPISVPVAYLQADTGGDSMLAAGPRGYGLELHVVDETHQAIPVARCDRISGGSALGGGTARELDAVICEGDADNRGEYWLISEPGVVSVRRGPPGPGQKTVVEHRLRHPQSRAAPRN